MLPPFCALCVPLRSFPIGIICVTALILHHAGILQGEDPADHTIQKIPVMGHDDDDAWERVQIILQYLQGGNVQIVSRLIQKM